MSSLRTLSSAVVASLALAPAASAAEPKAESSGIVVVGSAEVSDEVQTIARSAYARPLLRPTLDEREVERLAGGDLGSALRSARDLNDYLRAHSLRGAILVDRPGASERAAERAPNLAPRVRLLVVRKSEFETAPLQPSSDGDWTSALNRVEVALRENEPKSFYSSGWFWGALGGAALLGLVVVAAAAGGSSASDRSHLVVRFP